MQSEHYNRVSALLSTQLPSILWLADFDTDGKDEISFAIRPWRPIPPKRQPIVANHHDILLGKLNHAV